MFYTLLWCFQWLLSLQIKQNCEHLNLQTYYTVLVHSFNKKNNHASFSCLLLLKCSALGFFPSLVVRFSSSFSCLNNKTMSKFSVCTEKFTYTFYSSNQVDQFLAMSLNDIYFASTHSWLSPTSHKDFPSYIYLSIAVLIIYKY